MTPARNTYIAPAALPTGHVSWSNVHDWSTPPSVLNRRSKPFPRHPIAVPSPAVVYPAATGVMNMNWHQPWSDHTTSHQYHLGPVTELSV